MYLCTSCCFREQIPISTSWEVTNWNSYKLSESEMSQIQRCVCVAKENLRFVLNPPKGWWFYCDGRTEIKCWLSQIYLTNCSSNTHVHCIKWNESIKKTIYFCFGKWAKSRSYSKISHIFGRYTEFLFCIQF